MPNQRYLTKSKFKLAMECPTKLFYTGKPEYADQAIADTFLAALVDGGFQVGALARCYFPNGTHVETPNDETAVELTAKYLRQDRITLYEAGFCTGNLLIRADIIVKESGVLELYEVKAKSCDFADHTGMMNKKDNCIHGDWLKYLQDVAFQKYVITKAFPAQEVRAHLVLADKTVPCPTNGLNQKFRLTRDGTRRAVETSSELTAADLEPKILRAINVDKLCDEIFAGEIAERPFEEGVQYLAKKHANDEKISWKAQPACKDCKFRTADGADQIRSGFQECWTELLGWTSDDFLIPNSFDVWYIDKRRVVEEKKFKMADLDEAFIGPKDDGKPGLSRPQRQWKQVFKVQGRDASVFIDLDNLRREMESWHPPFHFIDFEGSKPVIPFLRGRRPYEDVAFQFSHHLVDANDIVSHAGEYLNATPGTFPNYAFVRALMRELSADEGAIFRYHAYENTMLCSIRTQLLKEEPGVVPDRDELCHFIESITQPTGKLKGEWQPGKRNMIDLHQMVTRYYYDPATNGSISIKYVLPATLNSSMELRERYSQPIYGSVGGIRSANFVNHTWVVEDKDGRIRDPYKLLPPLFTDESAEDYAAIMAMDKIEDGGAAMTAYCKLQFEDIPANARSQMEAALLKYCELDTLAMVMIYEAWKPLL